MGGRLLQNIAGSTMLSFEARVGFADSIDGVQTVGFSEDDSGQGDYVIVQRSVDPDDQDKLLGHDKPNFQVSSDYASQYGGLLDYIVSNRRLVLSFDPNTTIGSKVSFISIDLAPLESEIEIRCIEMLNEILSHK